MKSYRKQDYSDDARLAPHAYVKTYLQLDAANIIDRDAPGGEEAWVDLCSHHCHGEVKEKMFILDRFWGEDCKVYDFIMAYLSDNGVEVDAYDDILLNVTW